MAHPPDGLMEEDSVTADDHHCANDGGHVSPGVRHLMSCQWLVCGVSSSEQLKAVHTDHNQIIMVIRD